MFASGLRVPRSRLRWLARHQQQIPCVAFFRSNPSQQPDEEADKDLPTPTELAKGEDAQRGADTAEPKKSSFSEAAAKKVNHKGNAKEPPTADELAAARLAEKEATARASLAAQFAALPQALVKQTASVRRGKQQQVQKPATLAELVSDRPSPILGSVAERIEVKIPKEGPIPPSRIRVYPGLHSKEFEYPIHPSTARHLRDSINLSLAPKRNNPAENLPAYRDGLLVVNCPMKGSDIYIERLVRAVASENECAVLSIRNDDLFDRFTGNEVVRAPPLRPARQNGSQSFGRGAGRKRWPGNAMILPIQNLGGIQVQTVRDEENDTIEDEPVLPYPWFKAYQGAHGQEIRLARGRQAVTELNNEAQKLVEGAFQSFFKELRGSLTKDSPPTIIFYKDLLSLLEAGSEEDDVFRAADIVSLLCKEVDSLRTDGFNILLVAPYTPYTSMSHRSRSGVEQRGGGIKGILRALSQQEDDDFAEDDGEGGDGGGSGGESSGGGGHPAGMFGRRNSSPKGPSYDTPLSRYLGIQTVNVYAPAGVEFGRLQKLLERDSRTIKYNENFLELWRVAHNARVQLPADPANPTAPEANEANQTPRTLATTPGPNDALHALTTRFLNPLEIEGIIFHSIAAFRQRQTPQKRQKSSATSTIVLTASDLRSACHLFEMEQLALREAAHGSALAGVFRHPRMGDSKKTTRLTNREQKLLKQCLVKPNPASASFKKIGGLGRTKRTIHELISFPLMRPELFSSGILSQSTTGILLFGPPGTGKTLLARAVAAESGANFLNVQMSDIQSMWVGENEKNVKSLFTLARKLRPCVIFIDEIDALLRARQRNMAHHTNTINEFMQEWDGLNSNNDGPDADGTGNTGGIIVVGATNRPFDLDEAVLRRLPRRILVSLPDRDARADIVRLCLKDDEVLDRDNLIVQVAEWTEGWSGSDIRNFCIAAALISLRTDFASRSNASTSIPTERVGPDVKPPISLAHFKEALDAGDVRPSLNDRAELVKALRDWDKQYGTGAGGARGGAGEWGF